MDLDLQEDTDFKPSDEGDDLSEEEEEEEVEEKERFQVLPSINRHNPKLRAPGGETPASGLKLSSKWERLQPLYNDRYLELFQQSALIDPEYFRGNEYQTSQLGAVTWEATEKARFFEALPRTGRHNLPLLAKHVGTKSQSEIKGYLIQLESDEIDRQLFEKQTKNVSQADIPAAVEVGPECETRLEQAADALAAFQEQYDYAFGQQDTSIPFVITHDVASILDNKTKEILSTADGGTEEESAGPSRSSHELFNVLTFIELSEKFFMHGSQRGFTENWRALAEEGESPSMTQSVVAEFHELVTSLLRRLVQTTLFLTQSRLRASTTKHVAPTRVVTVDDVLSTLRVLHLRDDIWGYWTSLPRRAGFNIVSGSHNQGDSNKRSLSYDEVEAILSVRRSSGRRRSLSVTSDASSLSSAESAESRSVGGEIETAAEDTDLGDLVDEASSYGSEQDMCEVTKTAEEAFDAGQRAGPTRLPPNKRKRLLEEELDQYLEVLDQQARRQEDARIFSILGMVEADPIKEEPLELGRRPKVPRKSGEEVVIWAPAYQSEWESHPRALSDLESLKAEAATTTKEEHSETT